MAAGDGEVVGAAERPRPDGGWPQEERMATTAGMSKDLVELMNDLIALDFDAIEAYEAAIARLGMATDRESLGRFMADHRQHVTDLSALVREMGEKPQEEADFKRVLTKGKVVLAGLLDDSAVLKAMKSNEDDTNSAYERATQHRDAPERVMAVFQKNLGDERRHREWIERRLQSINSKGT